ncbi:hypothetical protein WJX81_003930 [Elliptochloris bilobata]|uniref:ZN622/Rei1/Reh1 zinc finger C2H2-type domain-containing protein n=1 Tax=Elliptochloris bilobata TaxID=381761 RepID=A0AAW1RC72_9CHLO
MVRFHWHVEHGLSAYCPREPAVIAEGGVRHIEAESEVSGQKETLPLVFTTPPNCLVDGVIRDVGVLLAHSDAVEWKGKLLTELAVTLAASGYVVLRFCCKHKEARRHRMYEKALDSLATAPYARGVTHFVLAGIGSGARAAAAICSRTSRPVAGLLLLAYPLQEVVPLGKSTRAAAESASPVEQQTSEAPLLKVDAPCLFVVAAGDPLCPPAELAGAVARMPATKVHAVIVEDVDQSFRAGQDRGPSADTLGAIGAAALAFLEAVARREPCSLPRAAEALPPPPPSPPPPHLTGGADAMEEDGPAHSAEQEQAGLYCSTSGTFFLDKDSLAAHYKSDFHRYNLKRKIAGLPPVTREWFDARKEQLTATARTTATKVWVDPLTRRRFGSENTYLAHVNSNKYKELVRRSGRPAPDPVIVLRRADAGAAPAQQPLPPSTGAPYVLKGPNGVDVPINAVRQAPEAAAEEASEGGASDTDGSGWETASDSSADDDAPSSRPTAGANGDWDVCCSLFDGHVAASMAANLEHMWKRFGFYFPEAQHLADPEGLLKYLGAKLIVGRVPLYARGDDANARQFGSLHAVQRHMADTGRFKMAWEDNEDEYDDFYRWPDDEEALDAPNGKELAMADGEEAGSRLRTGGYELAVGGGGSSSGGGKVLGSRQLARYYRQSYRPADARRSVAVASVLAQYRALGIATESAVPEAEKRAQRARRRTERLHLNTAMRGNVNRNLPRNVPY